MLVSLSSLAGATPPPPTVSDFAVETRSDAPSDAEIVLDANYAPAAVWSAAGAVPAALETEVRVALPSWNEPRAVIRPPAGGWPAGQPITVSVSADPYASGAAPITLDFGAVAAPAPDPIAPTIVSVGAPGWSDATNYPWGCCAPTRRIELVVETGEVDPWARVELVGDFSATAPSEITTAPVHQRLDLAVGPGPHRLSFVQWLDDDHGPLPPCVSVAGVSADGRESAPVEVCPEVPPPPPAPADTGGTPVPPRDTGDPRDTGATDDDTGTAVAACGCANGRSAPWSAVALLAAVGLRRRHPRSPS